MLLRCITSIFYLVVVCSIGQSSSDRRALFDNSNDERPWQLDIKKAKTIARVAKNGEALLSRKKRGWWWGERREEREENRECQSRCWGAWGAASQCSVNCGTGGIRTRRRVKDRTDCACIGVDWRSETCGMSCQNGGTPRINDCACPAGFSSSCCETRVTCGHPGLPAHGLVTPDRASYDYNTRVQYSCNTGREIGGTTVTRTCQSDGQWSGTIPVCTKVQCQHPGTPANGNMAPLTGFVYELLVQFSCNPGFTLVGSETSTCHANRQWSHSPPTCNRISCGDPGFIPDGTVTGNSYMFEDIITYSCDPGFTLIGPSERQCLADGTWSCNSPRCTSSVSLIPKCQTLHQIDHGSLTLSDDNNYQSIGEYECSEGYYLNGDSHRACQADQQWSGTEPSCDRITCPRLTNPTNGGVDQPTGAPEYGSQATYTCNSGYRLDGDSSVTCKGSEASGMWSASPPECHAVDCGAPTSPENGRIVGNDYTYQHTVDVQCGPGFYLDGPAQLTCNENGAWVGGQSNALCIECPFDYYKSEDSSALSCTRCPDNSHTVSTTSNNILQCRCDTGHEGPDGGPCTIITCPILTAPNFGVIEPCNNEYQSYCTLSCNSGYTVNAGDLTRQCQATGSWSGEPLKCSACPKDTYQNGTYGCKRCPDNAVTTTSASVFADCTCAPGFASSSNGQECLDINECDGDHPCQQECINIQGSFRCDCQPGFILNGLPENDPTDCVRAVGLCPAEYLIPPPNGGFVCGVVNVYEEYCSAYCNPGFEIEGLQDDYITCNTATRQWNHILTSNNMPICLRIIFDLPFMIGRVNYFEVECAGMTEQQKETAKNEFIGKIESYGICSQQPGGSCQVESVKITCGEERQAPTDTLNFTFNFTINVDCLECTEIDCQEKYDRLVQAEEQRIQEELHAASQLYPDGSGCPLCISDPNTRAPSHMTATAQVMVSCPNGCQQKGYSCRQCARGTYIDRDSGQCTMCPVGEYQPEAGQTSCLSCPFLTALNKLGARKCPVLPGDTYDCETNNPCLAAGDPNFKFFYPYTEATKYVQCSGHVGRCFVMPCNPPLVWSPTDDRCVTLALFPINTIY